MKGFIYIINFCMLYHFHTSAAEIIIRKFRLQNDVEVIHHYKRQTPVTFNVNFTYSRPTSTGNSAIVHINFVTSVSLKEIVPDSTTCQLANEINETVYITDTMISLEIEVNLMFSNKACCQGATSLCIEIKSADNEAGDCLAYNHNIIRSDGAGHKDCEDGLLLEYVITICVVCGVMVITLVVVVVCCYRKKIGVKEDVGIPQIEMDTVKSNQAYSQEEDEENSQPHKSIDLRKDSKCNQSFTESDQPLIKCNLPSMDSFFFPTPSKPLPEQDDRLPQEFLNAFMKKYLEFVNEWNESTSTGVPTPAPYVFTKNEKAPSSKTSRSQPPKSRISIKRRQNKGVSAIYVNQWDSSMELKREKITLIEKVGEGQFGEVHKATIKLDQTTMTVAVKQLKSGSSTDDRNNFLRELATHALLEDHPNVIKLIGCCIEKEPILVVFEYMSKGNLLEYLRKSPENVASALNYVVTFGHHVAKGMEFLAATEIIHRDLAARNILINEAGMCKVADFGFAKDVFGVRKYTKKLQTAPLRWMAPESLVEGVFSTQSDVWSFGVLLWEIVTLGREVPYYNIRSNEIKKKVKDGIRLRKPGHCPTDLYEIMSNCWKAEPEERLTFQRICQEFEVLERLGQYTPESSASQERKSSGFYRLYNKITRQISGNGAV